MTEQADDHKTQFHKAIALMRETAIDLGKILGPAHAVAVLEAVAIELRVAEFGPAEAAAYLRTLAAHVETSRTPTEALN